MALNDGDFPRIDLAEYLSLSQSNRLLTFEDRDRNVGLIDETLNVTYEGTDETAAAIEAYIDDLQTDGAAVDETFAILMVELIGVYGIYDIQQWLGDPPESHPFPRSSSRRLYNEQ